MTDRIDAQLLKGRPYGGTGFLFDKELSCALRARIDLVHKRVSVMELQTEFESILLINAYMPYYNTDNNVDQLIEYRETVAFIENIMQSNSQHHFILLMDLNCNIYGPTHPYSELIKEMMREFQLISGFEFYDGFSPDLHFTRSDPKRNSYTLIDGILLSKSLAKRVLSCQILDPATNVSDHLPIEIILDVKITKFYQKPPVVSSFIPRASLTDEEAECYRDSMTNALRNINVPFCSLNHGNGLCNNCDCIHALEKFYVDILTAIEVADRSLPRKKHGVAKPFWTPTLTSLKQKSCDAHDLWKTAGCPRSGAIFVEKNASKMKYKLELRKSKNEARQLVSDRMSNNLMRRDGAAFWKSWNRLNGSHSPPSSMIDGNIDYGDISDCFSRNFKSVYSDSHANDSLRDRFMEKYSEYCQTHSIESAESYLFTWSEMLDAMTSLKVGKSTSTFVKAEHIFYGCPELLCYLHLLFNALLLHSYVPQEFLCGTISPVVKDANGDLSDSNNYRAVTLGPIFSQLFDILLLQKFGHFLTSDTLQMGFKSSHSTSHSIFVLRSCVEYYIKHGSNVFVTFLDCSKAFDTISHFGIFLKLMERKVPLCFLNIVIYICLNLKSRCGWRGNMGDYFDVLTGVKQGGVMSPRLFTLYMDELIHRLRQRGVGCHVLNTFVACLFYADDLCLIAPTRSSMQEMLKVCEEYCAEFNLKFNVKKSKTLVFGPPIKGELAPLILDNKQIEFVNEWKYLGVYVVAGKQITFSARQVLASFYRATNSILSSVHKPSELILMNLLFTNCVPILTYAAEAVEYSATDMRNFNTALNNALRRIFSFQRWESIRYLRQQLDFPNIYEIFNQRFDSFIGKNFESCNDVIRVATSLFVMERLN